MPGLHSAMSRHLFTLNGNVLLSGGAKNLAKGQFTIVKSGSASANGAEVVSNFAGLPENTVLEMRVGKHKVPNVRTARNSKPYSSETFTVRDVVRVNGNFPKVIEQKFDDLIVGFDGINANTAISLEEGQTTVMDITLSGGHVEFITGQKQHVIKMHFGREVGETNQQMILRLVDRLKRETLPQGVPVVDLMSVKPVNSENVALTGDEYVFSTLTLTDSGDSNALADVQAQYPDYEVKLTSRNGLVSTYTILAPAADVIAAYTQTVASYPKGCEDCAVDYSEIPEGVVYAVKLEDDGADLSATVATLPGTVLNSVQKKGNKEGFGTYTVVLDNELTQAEIDTFVATSPITLTSTVEFLGDVRAICDSAVVTSTAWVDGDSCFAQVENYQIQLKDDDCDGSRLAELQAAYPELTIVAGAYVASQAVTLTGTSGTADITVEGTDYAATFAVSLTQTATDFVAAHGASILASKGITVTAAAGVLTFTDSANGYTAVSIINTTGNLSGTVAAASFTTTPTTGGCQRVYSTQVVTNIVCDECDAIFLDTFTSTAPESFDFVDWELVSGGISDGALMGIRLTGKPFIMFPTEATRDQIPFYETSTRINVSGGYIETTSNSFDPIFSEIFSVKRLSRAQDRDNLGWNLLAWEEASRYYFDGEVRKKDNLFAKAIYGQESVLKFDAQYVSYEVTIHDSKYSQAAGQRSDMGTTYVLWAEFGRHSELEDYVNSLAQKAGLSPVQIAAE